MHYEIEQAGLGHKPGPDVGTHAEPERWHVVNVFNADSVPMPLRFDTGKRGVVLIGENSGGPGVRLREPEVA